MKHAFPVVAAAAVLLLASCSPAPDLESGSLHCGTSWEGGGFIGWHFFRAGALHPRTPDDDHVDLTYYFDEDDCAQGAILGRDDGRGHLFPVGHRPWSELIQLEPPAEDAESVAAITPLTEDKEGLAFWVKVESGEFVLVRIRNVVVASHADLVAGATPSVELEWLRTRTTPH